MNSSRLLQLGTCLVLALLFSPVVSAGLSENLSATSLTVDDSDVAFGPLVAFVQESQSAALGGAVPEFSLQASHLRIETDNADPVLHAAVATNRPTSTSQEFEGAQLQGITNRENYRWFLVPIPGESASMVVSSPCVRIASSDEQELRRAVKVSAMRNPLLADTSSSLKLETCSPDVSLTIRGNLQLALWEWDALLTTAGESELLQSGSFQSSFAPAGAPDGRAVVSHDKEIFLFATNATLTVPLAGSGYELYTGPGTQIAANAAELRGAIGNLIVAGKSIDLDGDSIKIDGEMRFALAGTKQARFAVELTGEPTNLAVDGVNVSLTSTRVLLPTSAWISIALVTFLCISLGLRWRQSPSRAARRALQLVGKGVFGEAVKIANRAARHRPSNPTIVTSQACVLTEAGLLKEALTVHDRVKEIVPDNPSAAVLNAIQAAQTCVALNRMADAAAWVAYAYRVDPIRAWGATLDTPLDQFRPGTTQDPSYS